MFILDDMLECCDTTRFIGHVEAGDYVRSKLVIPQQ